MNESVTCQVLLGRMVWRRFSECGVEVATKTSSREARVPSKKKKRAAAVAGPMLTPEVKRALAYLCAIALCGFIMLSLLSYSAKDPAFSSSSSPAPGSNRCGRLGLF